MGTTTTTALLRITLLLQNLPRHRLLQCHLLQRHYTQLQLLKRSLLYQKNQSQVILSLKRDGLQRRRYGAQGEFCASKHKRGGKSSPCLWREDNNYEENDKVK